VLDLIGKVKHLGFFLSVRARQGRFRVGFCERKAAEHANANGPDGSPRDLGRLRAAIQEDCAPVGCAIESTTLVTPGSGTFLLSSLQACIGRESIISISIE
jgi:hypothetical protein